MTNFDFMQAAEKKVAQCWAKLMQKDNKVFPTPRLTFDLRGTIAGQSVGTDLIRLNMGFVAKESDDMLSQTVPHEVAHAWLKCMRDPSHVASYQYASGYADQFSVRRTRRQPHGPTFMSYLRFLGGEATRCHKYDVSQVRTKQQHRWAWKCVSCGKVFQLSTCRHNKALRGKVYFHPQCGSVNGRLERVY